MSKFTGITAAAIVAASAGMNLYAQDVSENGFTRTVLLEEFTTEKCRNCPPAAEKLHNILENPDYEGRLIAVCHHAGFETDWLTLPTDEDYLWLYNSNGSVFAPAMMIDRTPTLEEKTAVFGMTIPTEEDIMSEIDKRLTVPSTVSINASVSIDDDDLLTVDITGERTPEENGKPMVTVYLVENNIPAVFQSGAGEDYIHQHVTRALNKTWGEQIKWNGDSYTYQCTFELDETWKRDDMEVVAIVNRDIPSNVLACEVINATSVSLRPSEVRNIAEEGRTAAAYYDMQGTRLKERPARGLYITVYSDGSSEKSIR